MDKYIVTDTYNYDIFTRLSKLNIDVHNFIKFMKEDGGIIAGSFPLQCILNEEYENSDIDVFIQVNESVFNQFGFFTKLQTYLYSKGYDCKSCNYIIDGILKSFKYINGNVNINIVLINCNVVDFINNTFDLSFCQTHFDGDYTYYEKYTLYKKGYIENDRFNFKENKHNLRRKDLKVEEDSSPSTIPSYYPHNPQEYIKKLYEYRKDKYEKRGFEICQKYELELQLFSQFKFYD